jgi:hypothetical protein
MYFSSSESCVNMKPEEAAQSLHDMLGPQAVDQAVRQAIATCWMILPQGKKSVDAVEAEIRRIVERALKDLREDAKAFGIPESAATQGNQPAQPS